MNWYRRAAKESWTALCPRCNRKWEVEQDRPGWISARDKQLQGRLANVVCDECASKREELLPSKYYTPERLSTRQPGKPPRFLFHFTSWKNAVRHLENGDLRGSFNVISLTENPSLSGPGNVVFVIDSGCLIQQGFVVFPHVYGSEFREAEWQAAPPGSQMYMDFAGTGQSHAFASGPLRLPMSCVERVSFWGPPQPELAKIKELSGRLGIKFGPRFDWSHWWKGGPLSD